jgi:hypothetical protein
MAQPDFPSSPINGQTYTAPSGIQYTWDGQVWGSSSTSQSWLWTDTGAALTPYVATRQVSVAGPSGGAATMLLGVGTTKTRLSMSNTATWGGVSTNVDMQSGVQDDNTKPSWQMLLRSDTDSLNVSRRPPAGGSSNLFTLDNAGHLTFKAMACDIWNNNVQQGPLTAGAWTTVNLGTLRNDSSGGTMPNVATNQIKTPVAGWCIATASAGFTGLVTGGINILNGPVGHGAIYNDSYGVSTGLFYSGANNLISLQVSTAAAATITYASLAVIWLGTL